MPRIVAGLTTDSVWLFLSEMADTLGYRSIYRVAYPSDHWDGVSPATSLNALHNVSNSKVINNNVAPALFPQAMNQRQELNVWVLDREAK